MRRLAPLPFVAAAVFTGLLAWSCYMANRAVQHAIDRATSGIGRTGSGRGIKVE